MVQRIQRLKARVNQPDNITAQTVKVRSDIKLGDLSDVNTSGQSDGVMMIYDSAAGEYKVTTQIENENLNIIGGTY